MVFEKDYNEFSRRHKALDNPLLADKMDDIIEDHLEAMMASSDTARKVHKDFEKMRTSQVVRS